VVVTGFFFGFEIWFFGKCYVIYLGIVKSWKRRKREEKKSGVTRERFFFGFWDQNLLTVLAETAKYNVAYRADSLLLCLTQVITFFFNIGEK
jgi:hypothetical protein